MSPSDKQPCIMTVNEPGIDERDGDETVDEQEQVIQQKKTEFHTAQKGFLDELNEGRFLDELEEQGIRIDELDVEGVSIDALKQKGEAQKESGVSTLIIGVDAVCETIRIRRSWSDEQTNTLRDELSALIHSAYDADYVDEFDTEEHRVWQMGLFGAVELLRQFAEWKHYDSVETVVSDFVDICDDNLLSLREKYAARLYRRDGTNIGVVEEGDTPSETSVMLSPETFGMSVEP